MNAGQQKFLIANIEIVTPKLPYYICNFNQYINPKLPV